MYRVEQDKQRDTEYIATVLWSIGKLLGGNDYPMPEYSEFVNPKPADNRTTEQITAGLIEKLQGKGEEK